MDTSRQISVNGERFVLWDGNGLVVKRVERAADGGPDPGLRVKSTNLDYAGDTAPARDMRIVSKVLSNVRMV